MEKKKPISEVHNIDCIEYMRTLPDNYFDLAVCDPPYGMANSEIGGGNRFHKRFERYFTPASQQSSQGRTEGAILRTITPPNQRTRENLLQVNTTASRAAHGQRSSGSLRGVIYNSPHGILHLPKSFLMNCSELARSR